jgi:hypothetical protein
MSGPKIIFQFYVEETSSFLAEGSRKPYSETNIAIGPWNPPEKQTMAQDIPYFDVWE